MAWDGGGAVTTSAPPAGSGCPIVCDHWEQVLPGDYVFTVETLSGAFTARAAVPDSAGVIPLPING